MLKEKLMKHLGKKGKKDLDPMEKDAKMGVVKELSRQAGAMLGDKIHPLKKVEVASDSKEGLKEGLAKAAGLVDKAPDHEHDPEKKVEQAEEELNADLDKDSEEGESSEHAANVLGEDSIEAEHADCSPEELDAKIQKLMELKHKKESEQA